MDLPQRPTIPDLNLIPEGNEDYPSENLVGVAGQPRIPTELFALDRISKILDEDERKPEVIK